MNSIDDQINKLLQKKAKNIVSRVNAKQTATVTKRFYQNVARKGFMPKNDRRMSNLNFVTIDLRERLAQYNRTHSKYSAGYSNATFSGELIDSYITYAEKRPYGFSVGYVIPDQYHSGYKTEAGGRIGGRITYPEIRAKLSKLKKDPAGILQRRSSPNYKAVKFLIQKEIGKSIS